MTSSKPQGHSTATEARKKPPVSPPGGISMPMRCLITGNLCGTDTWQVGRPCKCAACQKYIKTTPVPAYSPKPIYEKDRIIPRIDPDLTDYEKECRVETDSLRECLTDYSTIYDGCDKCKPQESDSV